MSDPADMTDREGLAAEYVLGTLPYDERLEAERMIASDAGFLGLVQSWSERLAPLNDDYVAISPPIDLWSKIEARLFPSPVRTHRWRLGLFGALAAGIAAMVLIVAWPTLHPHQTQTATLVAENQPLVVAAIYDQTAGKLTFSRTAGPAAGEGKDYELWVIPQGGKAVSLGLLREGDLTVALDALPKGTTLAITLEPAGGAPGGVATGPIVVATVIGQS